VHYSEIEIEKGGEIEGALHQGSVDSNTPSVSVFISQPEPSEPEN